MNGTTKIAILAAVVSAASITYLYNNASGTNNELAMQAGLYTGVAILAAKQFKVI